MKRIFTLRKGWVKERINERLYIVKDSMNNNDILVSLSGKQMQEKYSLEVGIDVYVVVSPADLKRGRLLGENDFKSEYARMILEDKIKLDNNQDPLDQND